MRKTKKYFNGLFLFIDVLFIYLSFYLAWEIRFYNSISIYDDLVNYYNVVLLTIVIWFALTIILNLYHVPRTATRIKESFWYYIIYPKLILISILLFCIVMFNFDYIPRLFLVYYIIIQFFLLSLAKVFRIYVFQKLRISGVDLVNLGIISNSKHVNSVNQWITDKESIGYNLKNSSLDITKSINFNNSLKLIDCLTSEDLLLLNFSYLDKNNINEIISKAENKGIHIYRIIETKNIDDFIFKNRNVKKFGSIVCIKSRDANVKKPINIINKRFFDFTFSLFFILGIYWWVYIFVYLIIKFQSKGPVLFKQERIGLNGEIFVCYKFRTMHIDNTNSVDITKVGDSRIFSFGQFMRKANIDEFPQFINVFKGEMSVVGPRPHMLSEDKILAEKIDKYRVRRWVKPGITGYAAVKGYRGGTEEMELMQKRIDLDIKYIEKWSLWLDIKICFKTVLMTFLNRTGGH